MRVYILTSGSHGDVNPFLAIGRGLQARGHEVLLSTNPYFATEVASAGLELSPMGTVAEVERALKNEHLMHRFKGSAVVFDMIFRSIPDMLATRRRDLLRWRPDVVLAHQICIGARWLCRELGLPIAIAALAPIAWMSRNDPVPITQRRAGRKSAAAARLVGLAARPLTVRYLDALVNRARRQVGLSAERDAFLAEFRGGDKNLALWSAQFRGPTADDPGNGVICGFPWYDEQNRAGLSRELEQFLSEGSAPIVFSLGTAAVHSPRDFYAIAARACAELGRRGVLLTGRGLTPPSDLPDGVRAFDYAPFSLLLPRAAATVHHGGIGSTAQSLRSGRPAVIIPHAHDQFHNALHAYRIGVAVVVARHHLSVPPLVRALRDVLNDPAKAARANELGTTLSREDGAAVAVRELEAMVRA